VDDLQAKLDAAQNEVDDSKAKLNEVTKPQRDAEGVLSKAEDKLKKLTDEFDRFHKLAEQKRWKTGDWIRTLPIIEAFSPPTKIQQFTLEEYPINYNFKYVTRYDRCTTCH